MKYRISDSPFGHFGVVFHDTDDGEKAARIFLPKTKVEVKAAIKSIFPQSREDGRGMEELVSKIQNYLAGEERSISMEYLDTSICTPFQLSVLITEHSIPYGMTASYSWVALRINSRAYRAVGNALARNPFPLVVPCHRAVRSDRTIGKFQGGTDMKRRLLEMEGVEFDADSRVSIEYFMDR